MLSFRVSDEEADEAQRWAQALGVDRSELLREALHRHLVSLRSEGDAAKWQASPASDAELSLAAIADWGPADNDARHNVVATGQVTLPFQIQLAGILQIRSAFPFNVVSGRDTNNDSPLCECQQYCGTSRRWATFSQGH